MDEICNPIKLLGLEYVNVPSPSQYPASQCNLLFNDALIGTSNF